MTREEIFVKMQDVFKDIFENENIEIGETSDARSMDGWDSLRHIAIIDAIEKEFNVKFNFEQLALFINIGAIIDAVYNKLN